MVCVCVDEGEAGGNKVIFPEAILLLPLSRVKLTADAAGFVAVSVSRLMSKHDPKSFSWLSLVMLKSACVSPLASVVTLGCPKVEQSAE